MIALPRVLPARAVIGVCAPSGLTDIASLERGIAYLEARGHRVIVPPEVRNAWRYFAGTDEERLRGFNALLDDPAVDLVMCSRGGYGLTRLLPHIDWPRVGASGKIFVGFSDFTAFNCAACTLGNLATLHGPLLGVDLGKDDRDPFTEQQFWSSLAGSPGAIDVEGPTGLYARRVEGILWGGNLSLLAHLVGTRYFPAIDDGILYIEEVGEEPYAIERMFLQLFHAGVLARQRAVVLGSFADCVPKNTQRYAYSLDEAVETLRTLLSIPVLTGLPFGHVARKATLPFGTPGSLAIRPDGYTVGFSGHLVG